MESKNSWRRLTGLYLIGTAIITVAIAITVGTSFILYEHTVTLLTDNLRQRLLSIVTTAVVEFDAKDFDALQVEQDWKKPEWARVTTLMKKIRVNNKDIVFVYAFRKDSKDPTKMVFVADSHSTNPYANTDEDPKNDLDLNGDKVIDDADQLQWPGQEYPEPPEATFDAYTGPMTNQDLYEDQWGKVLTGYAPIQDEHGKTSAVLAVDIRANDFFTITRQTLFPFVVFIIVLTGAIVFLAIVIMAIWSKRVKLLADLDRQKDELLSIVSHQLATPITSVKWYLEMLLDGDIGKLSKEQVEHIKNIQSVSANLSELVSMILDVSRFQMGRMEINKQSVDLSAFFGEILEVIEPKAKAKGMHFIHAVPAKLPEAQTDKRLLHMIIENILANAINYTPSQGTVELKVEIKNNSLNIQVRDSGIGIPENEQKKIFEKLYRASNVRKTIEGNGFGLFIVKNAVEALGGKISLKSTVGKGTTFFLEIPLIAPTEN